MKKILLTGVILSIIITHLGAEGVQEGVRQEAETVTKQVFMPESVGMDSKRLANIDTVIDRYMADKTIPGAVVLVARHGKIVYHKAFGKADEGKPLTTDAIFRIMSLSKPIVGGTGILQLMDRGELMLSDPASRYFPGFEQQMVFTYDEDGKISGMVPAKREISLHDLLTFTAGFPMFLNDNPEVLQLYEDAIPSVLNSGNMTLQERASLLAHMPLAYQPGERWRYSNYSLDVLGAIVEQVSGKRFDRYMHENLFGPLKMEDTYFYPPEDKRDRVTGLYYGRDGSDGKKGDVYRNGGEGLTNILNFNLDTDNVYYSPGSGLHSTACDVFRYFQMLLNGGELDGVRILSEHAVKLMLQNHIGDTPEPQYGHGWGYSIGVQVEDAPQPIFGKTYGGIGSFSWDGYLGCSAFGNPVNDTVIVMMTHVWTVAAVWEIQGRIVNIVNRAVVD